MFYYANEMNTLVQCVPFKDPISIMSNHNVAQL